MPETLHLIINHRVTPSKKLQFQLNLPRDFNFRILWGRLLIKSRLKILHMIFAPHGDINMNILVALINMEQDFFKEAISY